MAACAGGDKGEHEVYPNLATARPPLSAISKKFFAAVCDRPKLEFEHGGLQSDQCAECSDDSGAIAPHWLSEIRNCPESAEDAGHAGEAVAARRRVDRVDGVRRWAADA